jgi:ankyrin repeat protein
LRRQPELPTTRIEPLIAALLTRRDDRLEIVRLFLARGAHVQQRGLNDWTPLQYAVTLDDSNAIELLSAGADPNARTRIDAEISMPGIGAL